MKPHGSFELTAHTLSDARAQAHTIVTAFLDGAGATVEITACEPYLINTTTGQRPSHIVGHWTCTVEWSAQ